jgi:hypothetical protein
VISKQYFVLSLKNGAAIIVLMTAKLHVAITHAVTITGITIVANRST